MVIREMRGEFDRASAQGLTYDPSARASSPRPTSGGWTGRARSDGAPPPRVNGGNRSGAQDEVHKMLFRGDITTGEGLIRLTERLVREFAAGKLEARRFEILMRAVRLMASLRRQFPAPPIDEPAGQQAPPEEEAESLVVEADRRPSAERAEELKREQVRPVVVRSAPRVGIVSAEPEPSRRPVEQAAGGDYKVKRRGEPARRKAFSDSRSAKSRHPVSPSSRRLRLPPPDKAGNHDGD